MKVQDIFAGIGGLILVFLLVSNWQGVNQILSTSFSGSIGMVKTLQGR